MRMPRRLINLIGTAVMAAIVLAGLALAAIPLLSSAHLVSLKVTATEDSNRGMQARIDLMSEQQSKLGTLEAELASLRQQITAADELRDGSALASKAAKASGARLVAVSFGTRQVFAAPIGGGIDEEGNAAAQGPGADANAAKVQIPVTLEAEVTSPAQAAAFIDGLRSGPRLLQVVEADCSPTNDAKRFTVTVDALIFAAKA